MSSVATRTFGAGRCYYVVQSAFRYGGKYGTIFSQGVGRLTIAKAATFKSRGFLSAQDRSRTYTSLNTRT